ncbi:MAG: NifB/NifX family molybdenum-iron cluster-binding protein [Candidatus Omnitrophica bacterium]|nr:NifB/NifX family molybdenum-iron cluster-binding protein [Candidatus Omnitrophota bacterium]
MKIAVTSSGKDLFSDIDPRFGRAQNFIIVDSESMEFKCVVNEQNINAPSGAGIQAGQIVAKSGAEILITGNCGPKAFAVLDRAKIKVVVGVTGTVKEAVEKYKRGELESTDSSNVEGHWM